MPKFKTYFPQVPVEVAKKVAEAEANGHASERLQRPTKKSANGNALADPKPGEADV